MSEVDLTPPAREALVAQSSGSAGGKIDIGTVVADRYKLQKLLGEGAMGSVYLAEHVLMRKRFALKLLHKDAVSSPEIVARFEREAVAAANVVHPGIVAATDFGRLDDGSFFLVLEYVAGKDLRHLLQEGALPPARALGITRQMLLALGAAHAKGIIHRDIKPENVMLVARDDAKDVVKILDFGIAKLDVNSIGEGNAQLTRMGMIYGTPSYMSPEQGLGRDIDHRADLYAVGMMLYEMLAGAPAFDGEPVIVIAKQVNEPPPPLVSPIAQLTPDVHALVDRLIAKERDERPADAHAAIALLDTALDSIDDRKSPGLLDTMAVTPHPPKASSSTTLSRVLDVFDKPAKRLGVSAQLLLFSLVGALSFFFLLTVFLVARKPSTSDDEPRRHHASPPGPSASTGGSVAPSTSASSLVAPKPSTSAVVVAPGASASTTTNSTNSGGASGKGGPIKKSGGGNSLVNKLKGIFK